jgi:hypothetical protein
MMRARLPQSLISPAIKNQTLTAWGTWHGARFDPQTLSASSFKVLSLGGLLVGVLILLLPSRLGHELPPQESFPRAGSDLGNTNDAPLSLAGLTAWDASLPPVATLGGISGRTHVYSWPLRYLPRPQRLTHQLTHPRWEGLLSVATTRLHPSEVVSH